MMKIRRILAAVALGMAMSAAQAQQHKQLVILHTNDTHSCIQPLSENLADTMLAGRGGFARRIAMLRQERQQDPDLLLFDSGDFCQGSPYFTLYKGDVETGLMNMMHYDAGTIGNHEFDYGLENVARMIRRLNFPIVCANYKFSQYGLDKLVKPYVILRRKGMKIGVFGIGTQLEGMVDKKNYENTVYLDPVRTAQQMADLLHRKKCDLVICLSHIGWEKDAFGDQELVRKTRGIDLVLGGHSHTYLRKIEYVNNLDGKPTPIDQNGKQAIYVGKIKVDMTRR
jgi:5'-nucleotidase